MSDQSTVADTVQPRPLTRRLSEATLQQKRLALSLISGCHVLNHLQYSITSVIFPVMMTELGFGLVGLGFHFRPVELRRPRTASDSTASCRISSNAPPCSPSATVVVGVTAMSQYFVGSYPQLVAARVAIDAGSSPQHPLGSSILSRYYPQSRGWALTFHHSAGNLGSFIGPAAASLRVALFGLAHRFCHLRRAQS